MSAPPLTRPQSVILARELWDSGAWSKTEIASYLQERGCTAHKTTIAAWADPARAARKARQDARTVALRAARYGSRPMGRPTAHPAYKLARMSALSACGMSPTAIAKVMRFDFGDVLGTHQIRDALAKGRYPDFTDGRSRAAERPQQPADPDMRKWIGDGVIAA